MDDTFGAGWAELIKVRRRVRSRLGLDSVPPFEQRLRSELMEATKREPLTEREQALVDSYNAKVKDFAAETLRTSAAYAAIRRTVSPILIAARLGEAPMFSGEFFQDGYPPDEAEALRLALGDDWRALCQVRLEPGRNAARLHLTGESTEGRLARRGLSARRLAILAVVGMIGFVLARIVSHVLGLG